MSLAFSDNGSHVATAGVDGTARVFEAATGKEVLRIAHGSPLFAVTFSRDGRYVATESAHVNNLNRGGGHPALEAIDYVARVFEAATGKEVSRMIGLQPFMAMTFNERGNYLAVGSSDNTARVFDVVTGREISRMTLAGPIQSVAFASDGRYLVTVSGEASCGTTDNDLIVTRHLLRPRDLTSDACSRLTRNLTSEEWSLYIGTEMPYRKPAQAFRKSRSCSRPAPVLSRRRPPTNILTSTPYRTGEESLKA